MIRNIFLNTAFLILSSVSALAETSTAVNELQKIIDNLSQLGNSKVEAGIKSGVVTLRGVVSSEAFKANLLSEVRQIEGVNSVVDELMVDPAFGQKVYSDDEVLSSVKAVLSESPVTCSQLDVRNGVVSLSIDANSFEVIDVTLAKIRGVSGVKDISSKAMVKGQPYLDHVEKNY